jgi:hypothetical protein
VKFQIVLFSICLLLALGYGLPYLTEQGPDEDATAFFTKMRTGKVNEIVRSFGDNTCNCPPKGGYISYIRYESGQEPNLAFMVGRKFEQGAFKTKEVAEDTAYIWPWDRPETAYVDVPLTFNQDKIYFLPLDMAFGKTMSQSDLTKFAQHPESDSYKGFSLRLRPTLAPGLIGKPPVEIQKEMRDLALNYLFPADAASVTAASGQTVPTKDVEAELPRLKQALLRLTVVRRGSLKSWKIAKFRFLQATVESPKGTQDVPLPLVAPGQAQKPL